MSEIYYVPPKQNWKPEDMAQKLVQIPNYRSLLNRLFDRYREISDDRKMNRDMWWFLPKLMEELEKCTFYFDDIGCFVRFEAKKNGVEALYTFLTVLTPQERCLVWDYQSNKIEILTEKIQTLEKKIEDLIKDLAQERNDHAEQHRYYHEFLRGRLNL